LPKTAGKCGSLGGCGATERTSQDKILENRIANEDEKQEESGRVPPLGMDFLISEERREQEIDGRGKTENEGDRRKDEVIELHQMGGVV